LSDLKNISGTFSANLFIQITTVIQGILVARLLGPEGKGEFAAIIMWPTLIAGIFIFGLTTGIARISAEEKDPKKLYLPILILTISTGLLGFLCSYILTPYLLTDSSNSVLKLGRLYSIVIVISHLSGGLLAVEQGMGRFKFYNLYRVILNPTYLLFLLYLFLNDNISVENCIKSLLIANCLVLLIRLINGIKYISFSNNISIKTIWERSFSFGIADMVMPVFRYLDQAIILWFLGTATLGFYTVALTASGVLGVITQTISLISFTQIAQNFKSADIVLSNFRKTIIFYVVFGLALALFIPFLLPFIFGEEFSPAIIPAIVLIFSSFFQGLGNILEQSLRALGKAFIGLEGRLLSAIIMAAFAYVFSMNYGLNVIVVGFVLAQLTFLLILIRNFKKHLNPKTGFFPNIKEMRMVLTGLGSILKLKLKIQ